MCGFHHSICGGYEVLQSTLNSPSMQISTFRWKGIHNGADPQTIRKLVFVAGNEQKAPLYVYKLANYSMINHYTQLSGADVPQFQGTTVYLLACGCQF